jgi:hypothetical protein
MAEVSSAWRGDRATDAVEIGGEQGVEHLPQAGGMDRRTGEPRLQEGQQPTLVEAPANFVERMGTVKKGETRAATPRPQDNTCSGGGGMIVSRRCAPASWRSIPRTTGQCGTGARPRIVIATRNRLAGSWYGGHHSGKSSLVTGHPEKGLDSLLTVLNTEEYIFLMQKHLKNQFGLNGPLEHGLWNSVRSSK